MNYTSMNVAADREQVVDRQSACLQGKERVGLDVQHSGLKRFPGPNDENFKKIAYQLRKMADNAEQVLDRKVKGMG